MHALGGLGPQKVEADGRAVGFGARADGGWEEEEDGCRLQLELEWENGVLVTVCMP